MFAIGDRLWPGVSKLVEEIGELGQVLGKLMGSRGAVEHWSGNLLEMLYEELGDVTAAIDFVIVVCRLDRDRIKQRAAFKLGRFMEWHMQDAEKVA
jgi:NTP pyrophosphatase (non-canonical NTP hydrolase)